MTCCGVAQESRIKIRHLRHDDLGLGFDNARDLHRGRHDLCGFGLFLLDGGTDRDRLAIDIEFHPVRDGHVRRVGCDHDVIGGIGGKVGGDAGTVADLRATGLHHHATRPVGRRRVVIQ